MYLGAEIIRQVVGVSSWRMAIAGIAIAGGIMLVAAFFLFEQTRYIRPHMDLLAHVAEGVVLEKVHKPGVQTEHHHSRLIRRRP